MSKLIKLGVLLFTITVLGYAQPASTTANITANVNATLTITRTADLTIGAVNQGQTRTITSLTAGAATFTVTGAANASTTVTVTFPSELTFGTNTMPFAGQIPRYNSVATQTSSIAFPDLTGGTATSNASGNLFLWVGGGVTASASQAVGAYTGTLTVSVTQP